MRELGILRELTSPSYPVDRVHDLHPAVASAAVDSLRMLAQDHDEVAAVLARIQQRV